MAAGLDQEVRKLDNTYFDTPGAALRLFGITLRRRVGGSETGWQLKVPSGTARTELQSGSRAKTLPPALAKGVEGLLAGESLDPVATIVTTRTAYRLLNADGELVLEIADDQVQSGPPDGESTLHSWREVEVELGPAGKKKDLKRARKLLQAAGASPEYQPDQARPRSWAGVAGRAGIHSRGRARSVSWWPRTWRRSAMCSPATTSECAPVRPRCTRHGWQHAGYAARCGYLATCSTPLPRRSWTTSWRGTPTCSARCATGTFSAVGLTKQIAELPPEQVRGPVEAEITKTLAAEREDAVHRLTEAMRTRATSTWCSCCAAGRPRRRSRDAADEQDKAAVKYVEKAKRKADKRLRKAGDDIERLHRARKAIKRARYAAELVEPADSRDESHRARRRGAANPPGRASRCRCRRQIPRHDQ